MAQKAPKKRFNLNIDEEKDVFLSSLNKKIRNARKKLDQIEELERKGKDTLKKEQLEKVNSRGETLEIIRYNESIKDLYYGALKAAQDEGKALPQQETQPRKQTEEDKTEEAAGPTTVEEPRQQAPARQEPVNTQEDNSRIIRETLSKVLNLVHFAQLFRDQSSVQGFRQAFDARRDEFGVDAVPDFESFHEFFVKVFTFSESDRFGKVGDKIERSLEELESYINLADQPALRNKTYRHLQSVVEGVAKASFFRDHNAEVEAPKARTHTEPSAIGSELRKGVEHQEVVAPAVQHQEKARSPEKEARTQPEPTRTAEKPAQQEEARKDWGSLEDEEEEEELVEENQQEKNFEGEGGRVVEEDEKLHPTLRDKQEEKKQADDGFISVKPKYKEKKEETNYRGSGTRPQRGRGGRGGAPWGDRGGYRKPREGEEGQEGGYRRPRREDQQEGAEGGEGQRGGYRGRGGRGQGRGQGRGEGRGGRGGYYGERREGQGQGERTATATEGVRTGQENA